MNLRTTIVLARLEYFYYYGITVIGDAHGNGWQENDG
jgi:hypothetical protein